MQLVRIFPARKLSNMVLIDVPDAVASAFRLGEGLGEPSWSCGKTAKGVFVNLRWSSCGATKPPKNASPLNSRQRRSKRRLEEFLSRKEVKLRKELSPLDNLSACKDAMIVDQRRQEDDGCKDAKQAKFTVVNNEGGGPEGALTRKTHSPATLAQTARTDITSTRVKVQEGRTHRPSCPRSDQRRRSTFKYRAGQRL